MRAGTTPPPPPPWCPSIIGNSTWVIIERAMVASHLPKGIFTRVQWFWLFFTFWGITTHPWHPKGPRIWKLAKKNFQLHPWPAEIFGKNRKLRFFGLVSKFNFGSPVWQIFTIFSAWFIYGIPNTHTKFEVSRSKTVVTREWSRQGLKFICLQNLRSKFYLTKI